MCKRLHRSQGGMTRLPRGIFSIRLIISALKGPPSSLSAEGLICGSKEAGVLGIATVGELFV